MNVVGMWMVRVRTSLSWGKKMENAVLIVTGQSVTMKPRLSKGMHSALSQIINSFLGRKKRKNFKEVVGETQTSGMIF